ncbi:ABC transporter permease [Bradyrhizobium prioriisuperbiae]|uniref:ABC transporter permease n=1 Tax=Bradyrhizobium prioriisuperbiae TaxID=2854389 RepID=UPI0028E7EC4C|nr:ABC transporter permease [Bradyrhizobium prioritasuperba]
MSEMTTMSSGAGGMTEDMTARPKAGRAIPPRIQSLILLVAFIVLWEGGVRIFQVPRWLIPPVSDIAVALWRGLATSPFAHDGFWYHSFITMTETVLGYLVGCGLGFALAVAISQTENLEAVLRPFIVAFQSLPKVAVAPIIVLWLGFGLASKVAIVALLTFFPVLITGLAGFQAVEPERIELLRSLSASRWHIFTKVKFWTALPFIFAGLEMAAAFAVVGAIVGEFVGAQSGLGVLILQLDSAMDVGGSFAVFVILSLIGIALSAIIRALQNKVLYWQPKQQTQRTINL